MAKAVNYVWNFCNETQRSAVRRRRPGFQKYGFNHLLKGSSKELGLHSQTVQAVGDRYIVCRKAAKRGYLRYRGSRALGWVPFHGQAIKIHEDSFRFSGHHYRVWLSRSIPGKIKCGSFSQDALGTWFINLCVEVPNITDCGAGEVGIDLGLKTTATMSNGQKYEGLRAYRAIEPALAVAQRACKKKRAKSLQRKAKNRRLDGLHKLSTQLVDENKLVAVGNVSSKALAKTKMAKSVYDAGWGLLRDMLRYKTLARGATYLEIDEYLSSQLCSNCGDLPDSRPRGIAQLRIREWVCTSCGQGHDRDINAARNILALGSERPAEGILAFQG